MLIILIVSMYHVLIGDQSRSDRDEVSNFNIDFKIISTKFKKNYWFTDLFYKIKKNHNQDILRLTLDINFKV